MASQEKEESLLADGEERWSQLRAAAKRVPSPFTVPPVPVVPDITDEMQSMQRVIDELQRELTRLKGSPVDATAKDDEGMGLDGSSVVSGLINDAQAKRPRLALWWGSVGYERQSHCVSRGTVRSSRDPGSEASHPGPASMRRRSQRLRALQRSMDSDGESDFDDDAMAGPTQVASESASRVAARRLVIVSQDVPVVPPETHAMTDSAGSDGGASSGFLDMFVRDLDPSEPMRTVPDIEEDVAPEHSDNDSVMSSRVRASEVDQGSTLDHESEIAVRHPLQQFRWDPSFKARIRSMIWSVSSRFGKSEAI